jgi:aromatic ring-cleaving dioxygenase
MVRTKSRLIKIAAFRMMTEPNHIPADGFCTGSMSFPARSETRAGPCGVMVRRPFLGSGVTILWRTADFRYFPRNQTGGPQMTDASTGSHSVHGYHAHIYYDPESSGKAAKLRGTLGERFAVQIGRMNDDPIGPHPISQFAAIFKADQFQDVVPWLMLNRDGLDILIHPLTDDMVDDHSIYAVWLGAPVALRLNTMQRRGYQEALLPAAE